MEELRGVAQFGSAPALGAGCRRFESCHPDCKTSQSSTDISAASPGRLFYCLARIVRKRCEKPSSQGLPFARLSQHYPLPAITLAILISSIPQDSHVEPLVHRLQTDSSSDSSRYANQDPTRTSSNASELGNDPHHTHRPRISCCTLCSH